MKKINIIDAISYFFASDAAGDLKGIYHPEIIKVHLNNVFTQVVYNTWLNGRKFSDFSQLDAWSKTYPCDVMHQVGKKAYAFLPFAPVQLPDNMGIRQVRSHESCYGEAIGAEHVFAYLEATANVVFAELEVSTFDPTPTFRLEQNSFSTGAGESSHLLRLENMPVTDPITIVDVMMIVPLEELNDFDIVAMPSGAEDNIIRQVVDLMSKKLPTGNLPSNVVNT